MSRRPKVTQSPAIGGYVAISDTVEVSRETRRARGRSEYGARMINTMANRRWGGSAITTGFRPEEACGAARMNPATARIKTRDESGISVPTQHMTATRKRDPRDGDSPKSGKIRNRGRKHDGAWTRLASEQEALRTKYRADAERRSLPEYK